MTYPPPYGQGAQPPQGQFPPAGQQQQAGQYPPPPYGGGAPGAGQQPPQAQQPMMGQPQAEQYPPYGQPQAGMPAPAGQQPVPQGAPQGQTAGGKQGKQRSPVVWAVICFFLFPANFYWLFKVWTEVKEFKNDDSINPIVKVILGIIPILNFFILLDLYKHIKSIQSTANVPKKDQINPVMYMILSVCIGFVAVFLVQAKINQVWVNLGQKRMKDKFGKKLTKMVADTAGDAVEDATGSDALGDYVEDHTKKGLKDQQKLHKAPKQQGQPPQAGAQQGGYPQQGYPQQGPQQGGMPQQGYPQQGPQQGGMPQQGYPQQGGMPQQGGQYPQGQYPPQPYGGAPGGAPQQGQHPPPPY